MVWTRGRKDWFNKAGKYVLIISSLANLQCSLWAYTCSWKAPMQNLTMPIQIPQARGGGQHKYHMVKWRDICMPKDQGGLGITSSWRMNACLMTKLICRLSMETEDYGLILSTPNT